MTTDKETTSLSEKINQQNQKKDFLLEWQIEKIKEKFKNGENLKESEKRLLENNPDLIQFKLEQEAVIEDQTAGLAEKISQQGFKSLTSEEIKNLDRLFDLYIQRPDKCSESIMSLVKSAVIDFDTFKYLSLKSQWEAKTNQNQIMSSLVEMAKDMDDRLKTLQSMSKAWATKEKLNLLKNL